MSICCCASVTSNEQLRVTNFTEKRLINGPVCCLLLYPWWEVEHIPVLQLKVNEYAMVENKKHPEKNKFIYGPSRYLLDDPWEEVTQGPLPCPLLDQDDYIVVTDREGIKRNVRGPGVFKPTVGDKWTDSSNTTQVPMNCYMIVNDANNTDRPIHHVRGPLKFFPEPFQTLDKDSTTGKNYFPCIEVTKQKAVHLQKADGTVIMLSDPQYYMPDIGEKVIATVQKIVLIPTDFCILKSPDGNVFVMTGTNADDRAFFLKPFYEFIIFNCGDEKKKILSTLPTFLSHGFNVRTSDNVVLSLELRISYQIQNVGVFAANPIDFYPYIRSFVQNELLDCFAQSTLRQFMSTFSHTAQGSAEACSEKQFRKFGIEILDVQILNYTCVQPETQRLLDTDIQTNVVKQNELRARQNDILIQEENNKVQIKQKELEVEIAKKDNEVAMKRKLLENEIRLKEMEIEIAEEHQRTTLLEVKRTNDLLEAEFVGRAKGHELKEFLNGIDPNLNNEQKIAIWNRQCDLLQAQTLYAKVTSISMLPPNSDLKLFNFTNTNNGIGSELDSYDPADTVKESVVRTVAATQGLNSWSAKKK